jgi:hypothetical protein
MNPILGIVSSSRTPRYVPLVLGDNPVGFWLLNETSGTTGDDLTANNNDLTFYNSPTLNVATGLSGTPIGITFDGTNDRLNTATVSTFNIACSSNWSLEFWLRFSTTAFSVPFAWRDGTGGNDKANAVLTVNNGTTGMIQLLTGDSAGGFVILSHTNSYNDDQFHHVVVTATSGGALRLYIDGVDRASSTTSRATATSNRAIILGANDTGGTYAQFFTGTQTACSIYNTALSATQVLDHYNAGK